MTIRLLTGDCRDVLPTLADASVHCVVTSPPYYGLRDYGTALWDGGDANCQHTFARNDARLMRGSNGELGKNCTSWTHRDATPPRVCSCGARRVDRQLGLEPTPDAYLAAMVGVFREVRRVLRDDGTCWVNVGDSFSGGNNIGWRPGNPDKNGGNSNRDGVGAVPGLAAKQLLLMPARLALALQADGWWVRSDIIWAKPNPMPESCRDRPTSAHEHVFLLTKRARYFYDADAVREPHQDNSVERMKSPVNSYAGSATMAGERGARIGLGGESAMVALNPAGRNLRNVWTIATHPYIHAHFATFPPLLAERCIRAGTSERGCCAACGAPWVRVTEAKFQPQSGSHKHVFREAPMDDSSGWQGFPRGTTSAVTTGWAASCACGAETVPATVLDLFSGAGTTALVADRLGRDAIGIDLSHQYVEMTRERITADCPLFTSWAPAEDPEESRMGDLFQDMAAD